jgi:hypothetical protein
MNKKSLFHPNLGFMILIFIVAGCAGTPSSLPPTPGEWQGAPDFGEFGFVVNPDGTTITKILFTFSEWTCGNTTMSGGMAIEPDPAWSIEEGKFTIETHLDPNGNQKMNIEGAFDETGTGASGTYEAVWYGTVCSGDWEASIDE